MSWLLDEFERARERDPKVIKDRLTVAEGKLARIRELHREVRFMVCDTGPRCELCDTDWPCSTVAILDGTPEEPTNE